MKMSYSIVYIQSINEVISGLLAKNIPLIHNSCLDGWQIRFPWCSGDISANSLTSCSKYGNVETFGFPWDEGETTPMNPQTAITVIEHFYKETVLEGE